MFDTVDIKGNKYFLIAVYINGVCSQMMAL